MSESLGTNCPKCHTDINWLIDMHLNQAAILDKRKFESEAKDGTNEQPYISFDLDAYKNEIKRLVQLMKVKG